MESKENCIVCQIIEGKIPSKKIYEDDDILVILDLNGANTGHSFVIPKSHYPIMEHVPDFVIGNVFKIANFVSSAIFESLNIQGTNIFVANGVSAGQTVAHFIVQVIPRNDNDGINLTWQTKQLNEEEMSTVEIKIKDAAKNIGYFEKAPVHSIKREKKETPQILEEDNVMVAHMNRIP